MSFTRAHEDQSAATHELAINDKGQQARPVCAHGVRRAIGSASPSPCRFLSLARSDRSRSSAPASVQRTHTVAPHSIDRSPAASHFFPFTWFPCRRSTNKNLGLTGPNSPEARNLTRREAALGIAGPGGMKRYIGRSGLEKWPIGRPELPRS